MSDGRSKYDSKGRPWPKYKKGDNVIYEAGRNVRNNRVIERRGLIIDRRWDTWNDWEYRMRPSRFQAWISEDLILRRVDSPSTTTTTTTTTTVVNTPAVSKKRVRREEKQSSKTQLSVKRRKEDMCDYEQLYNFKENMQKLSDPTLEKENYSTDGKVTRIYKYIDNDAKYGKKEFTVESFKNYCYVTLIKCIGDDVESRKKEGKCVVMEGGSDSYSRNYIIGSFDNEYVDIEGVSMEEAKGQGNCTKAVAYMIKTIMIEAEKRKNWFPEKGFVHIASNDACAALMCYVKAFMLNGYEYDKAELDGFMEKIKNNSVYYRFSKFMNKEQKAKRNTVKSQKESISKFMSIKLNNLKF